MRSPAKRNVGAVCLVALTMLTGCATHPARAISNHDLALAREFKLFSYYWAGRSFQGLPVTAADTLADYDSSIGVRVYYGDCIKRSSPISTTGCKLPLQITTVMYKPHSNVGLGPRHATMIRGVPAVVFESGKSIEIYTSKLAIDVAADTPRRARQAAEAVTPLNRKRPGPRRLAPFRYPLNSSNEPQPEVLAASPGAHG